MKNNAILFLNNIIKLSNSAVVKLEKSNKHLELLYFKSASLIF
ncbi:hypothetical protein BTEBP_10132 [Brochothrix thermosphacta]|nr:hypothetical protein BTEBP_10132 [Brochothrix thermosphacta]